MIMSSNGRLPSMTADVPRTWLDLVDVPRTWPRNSLDGSSLLSCPDLEAHALG